MSVRAAMILDKALQRGAAQADLFIKSGSTRGVSRDASGNVVWTRTTEGGIGLRVFSATGGCGFAAACGHEPSESQAELLVAAALDAARGSGALLELPAPSAHGAGGRTPDGRGLGIFDARLHAATPADLEGILDQAAMEALRTDRRVRRLDAASMLASSSEVELANTRGLSGSYRQTLVNLSLGVTASDGARAAPLRRSRTARTLASFAPRLFGEETARLAVLMLDGRAPAERTCAALLSPAAAVALLRAVARGLPESAYDADRAAWKCSGQLHIIDDGRLPGGIATAPFDGEGCPTRRTPIVTAGVLTGALHDLESAARAGAASSGNGVRRSFREPPRRQPTNLFITPGTASHQDLLDRTGDGIWIQMLRPMSAPADAELRFSALATGCAIRGGAPAEPFGSAVISGDRHGLLASVIAVGNDLTFGFPGDALGAPSLLLESVHVRPA